MYDRKNEANEFVGESLEEATANARRFYGVAEDDLAVFRAEDGKIHGVAERVVIVAVPKGAAQPRSRSRQGSTDSGRVRGSHREARSDRQERDGRGRDRRPAGHSSDNRSRSGRQETGEGSRRAGGRVRDDREDGQPHREAKESHGTAIGDVGENGEFLVGVIERMKLGSFEISESTDGEFFVYQVRGEAAEALRTGDGRAVDALQLLANQVSRQSGDDAPRVVVEVEGSSDDRQDSLEKLAKKAGERALETGRSVALDPMNSRDRRMIHIALRDAPRVATKSIGSGLYRQVVVIPEGAPDYEEAREASVGNAS